MSACYMFLAFIKACYFLAWCEYMIDGM